MRGERVHVKKERLMDEKPKRDLFISLFGLMTTKNE